jgi:hypothetical protein
LTLPQPTTKAKAGCLQAQLEAAAAGVASAERIAEVYQHEAEVLARQLDRRSIGERTEPEAAN